MPDWILDWIYPPKCLVCTNLIEIHKPKYFCQSCLESIEALQAPLCMKCGCPANTICADCAKKDFAFEYNLAAFAYDDLFRDLIHRFKYGKHPEYGAGLGKLLAKTVDPASFPDIERIIPVPIHPKRKRERGFNQSDLLARELSRAWRIPADYGAVKRIKYTKPQSSLGRMSRENNVKDAFRAGEKKYKAVLLVDDIYTTGCTLDACAQALRDAGVGRVYGCTLAIAVKK